MVSMDMTRSSVRWLQLSDAEVRRSARTTAVAAFANPARIDSSDGTPRAAKASKPDESKAIPIRLVKTLTASSSTLNGRPASRAARSYAVARTTAAAPARSAATSRCAVSSAARRSDNAST